MNENLEATLKGALANSWPTFATEGPGRESTPGYVHVDSSGVVHLETLIDPVDYDMETRTTPDFIPFSTVDTGGLLLDIYDTGGTLTFGSSRASSKTYTAQSVATSVNLADLKSVKATSVEAHFSGIAGWAGIQSVKRTPHLHPGSQRIKSMTIKVESDPPVTTTIRAGKRIEIVGYWQYSTELDNSNIFAPVSIRSISTKPTNWNDHLATLFAIQEILCLSYRGFVPATSGLANFELHAGARIEGMESNWWSNRLMRPQQGVRTTDTTRPTLTLSTLGGVDSLRRWIELRKVHPRATGPMLSKYRFGRAAAELRLIESAAAIEYYVAAHRRHAKWAEKRAGEPLCSPMVRHAGRYFQNWIIDPEKWSEKYWATYNLLKHDPDKKYDPYEIATLADSATVLLMCVLLDRIARTKAASRAICAHHDYAHLSERIAKLL